MERIEFSHLTRDEDGEMWYQGQLFTGIAIDYWPNNQLASETSYVDGIEDGWSRFWYDNGTLKDETFYKEARATGTLREWHRNGQLKIEEELEDAVCRRSKEWDEQGNLVKDYALSENHPHYRDLQSRRKRSGDE